MLSANFETRLKLGILSQNWAKIDILIGDTYLIHVILALTPPPFQVDLNSFKGCLRSKFISKLYKNGSLKVSAWSQNLQNMPNIAS